LLQLEQLSKQRYVSPYAVARVHATLGEVEAALGLLQTAYDQRAGWMVLLKVDPCIDNLRSFPRFQDLMRRMNFPAIDREHRVQVLMLRTFELSRWDEFIHQKQRMAAA